VNLKFSAAGMPVTKGSWKPGRGRGGRIVLRPDNDREAAWAALVGWSARIALNRPPNPDKLGRFCVDLEFTLEPPPNRTRANKRDIDKLARSVLDALTGIVWADDEQVDQLTVKKWIVGRSMEARTNPGLVASVRLL
jgi:hypothetical protein